MKTPLTRERIKQHLTYSWWKYVLLAVVTIFGWNIVYTMTAYRPPQEKTVDILIYGYGDEEPVTAYMNEIQQTEMSDMEQMEAYFLVPDETYGQMTLMARVAAGEGDIYILPRDIFQNSASEGWFRALDDQTELIAALEESGVDLDRGWRKLSSDNDDYDGQRHLYGIPLSAFPSLAQYVSTSSEGYVCVMVNNQNEDNVLKFLNILYRDMSVIPETAEAEGE